MKYFFVLSILLLSVSFSSYTQTEWAPKGTKWHYRLEVPFDQILGYDILESVGDTIIDSKKCRIINETWYYQYRSSHQILTKSKGSYIIYGNHGKVYNYFLGKFHLLYDFSLNTGDTLRVQLNPSNKNDSVITSYLIDSVDYIRYNGVSLKRQFFHYISSYPPPYYYFADGYFIENAGYYHWLLGNVYYEIDGFWARLRCYSDSSLSFNLNPIISCDSIENYYHSIENENSRYFSIQNPVGDYLFLDYLNSKPCSIHIVNNMGVIMTEINHITSEHFVIPTANYPKGIYYLILFNNKSRITKKFVKL